MEQEKIDHRKLPLTSRKTTLGAFESILFDKNIGSKYRIKRIVTKAEYKPS